MKKILLGLGSLIATITPIATLVACGTSIAMETVTKDNLISTKAKDVLVAVKNTTIFSIDDAKGQLGITLPENDFLNATFKSITWDNKDLILTIVVLYAGKANETKVIYSITPDTPTNQ